MTTVECHWEQDDNGRLIARWRLAFKTNAS